MKNSNSKKLLSVLSNSYILKELESIKQPLMTEVYEQEKDCLGNNFVCHVFTAFAGYVELFPERPILGPLKITVAQQKFVQKLVKAGCCKDGYFDEDEADELITKKDRAVYNSIKNIEIACCMVQHECKPDVPYYRINIFQSSEVPHIEYHTTKKEATKKLFNYIVTFGGLIPWNAPSMCADVFFIGYEYYCNHKKRVVPIKANKEQKGIVFTPDQCCFIYKTAMRNNDYHLLYNIALAKKNGDGLEIPFACSDITDAILSSVQALEDKTEDRELLETAIMLKYLQANYKLFFTK